MSLPMVTMSRQLIDRLVRSARWFGEHGSEPRVCWLAAPCSDAKCTVCQTTGPGYDLLVWLPNDLTGWTMVGLDGMAQAMVSGGRLAVAGRVCANRVSEHISTARAMISAVVASAKVEQPERARRLRRRDNDG